MLYSPPVGPLTWGLRRFAATPKTPNR